MRMMGKINSNLPAEVRHSKSGKSVLFGGKISVERKTGGSGRLKGYLAAKRGERG